MVLSESLRRNRKRLHLLRKILKVIWKFLSCLILRQITIREAENPLSGTAILLPTRPSLPRHA